MCGIAGVLHLDGQEPVPRRQVEEMTAALVHRGPDEDGFLVSGCVGLGMRRLKVIDLVGGAQPIGNETGTVSVVFNGEIYNYRELRERLEARGHVFSTDTDTEVIAHQYEEDGPACVEQFIGMFAFALWDATRGELLLARDRFGVKPLFVSQIDGKLAFASEIKALRPLPWMDWSWDASGLAAYLSLNYTPGHLTAFRHVRKLGPGTTETWSAGDSEQEPRRRTYWSPASGDHVAPPSRAQAQEETVALLRDSVRLRLRSDVPLGAFLSGGIDSTCVVALMRECGATDIRTFSIGFEDARYDESEHASAVAEILGTTHTPMTVTSGDAVNLLDVLASFDEPFGDASAIPTYFVSRLARQSVTVALSGDGGDELFAGYDHYRRLQRYGPWDRLPDFVRRPAAGAATRLVDERRRGGGFVRRMGAPAELRLLTLVGRPLRGLVWSALGRDLREFLACEARTDWIEAFLLKRGVENARFIDQRRFLVDDVMVKVDRASMAVSLEAREPLLDHRLADHANSLPLSYHRQGDTGKLQLRGYLAGRVPPRVIDRPKMGFAPPVRAWLLGALRSRTRELFSGLSPGLFDPDGCTRLLDAMERGERELELLVWNLLGLALWADSLPGGSRLGG